MHNERVQKEQMTLWAGDAEEFNEAMLARSAAGSSERAVSNNGKDDKGREEERGK